MFLYALVNYIYENSSDCGISIYIYIYRNMLGESRLLSSAIVMTQKTILYMNTAPKLKSISSTPSKLCIQNDRRIDIVKERVTRLEQNTK